MIINMKEQRDDVSMMDKMELIANLYYVSKLSQKEIAQKLNISRPWVSKLLNRAEEMGIVKIEVNSSVIGNEVLETAIRDIYGISKVSVIRETNGAARDKIIAKAAAHYFISKARPDDVIGIGWGKSVAAVINQIIPLSLPRTRIVPLAGSFGSQLDYLPNSGVAQLAEKIGGKATFIHSPAFCHSQAEYKAILSNPQTNEVVSAGNHADIHIIGMGGISNTMLINDGILENEEIVSLQNAGAVGDVALQFLDEEGNKVEEKSCQCIVKSDIFEMKKHAREILGVAFGVHKIKIIKAVLKNNLLTAFFTDEQTAQQLLQH